MQPRDRGPNGEAAASARGRFARGYAPLALPRCLSSYIS